MLPHLSIINSVYVTVCGIEHLLNSNIMTCVAHTFVINCRLGIVLRFIRFIKKSLRKVSLVKMANDSTVCYEK